MSASYRTRCTNHDDTSHSFFDSFRLVLLSSNTHFCHASKLRAVQFLPGTACAVHDTKMLHQSAGGKLDPPSPPRPAIDSPAGGAPEPSMASPPRLNATSSPGLVDWDSRTAASALSSFELAPTLRRFWQYSIFWRFPGKGGHETSQGHRRARWGRAGGRGSGYRGRNINYCMCSVRVLSSFGWRWYT